MHRRLLFATKATLVTLVLMGWASSALACTYVFTVSASPTSVCAGGGTSTITARVTSYGYGVAYHVIAFTVSGQNSGSVSPTIALTDFNGYAQTTYTSGSATGAITVTATDRSGGTPNPTRTCTVTVNELPQTPTVDDGTYAYSTSELSASWTPTGLSEYKYAIGTASGGTNIVDWTSTGTTASVTKTGLSLSDQTTYYFSVKAKNSSECWSSPGNSDGVVVYDPTVARVNRPLPDSDLNNAAGSSRRNIRWADKATSVGYGDDFTLASGKNWVVDKIVVWCVPDVSVSPAYNLSDYYSSVSLYGGPTSAVLPTTPISTGTFTTGNSTDNNNIAITSATYLGGVNYQDADGAYSQIWRIEFANPNFGTLTGGTSYSFGVLGVPRVDRLWFNHASYSAPSPWDGYIRRFDSTTSISPTGWFGKGSDINVQVFAHPQ